MVRGVDGRIATVSSTRRRMMRLLYWTNSAAPVFSSVDRVTGRFEQVVRDLRQPIHGFKSPMSPLILVNKFTRPGFFITVTFG